MEIFYIAIAFALGGILKGATGAGAPLIAVPLLALFYDVPTAVAVFVIPNLLPNLYQAWQHRESRMPPLLAWPFAIGGGLGVIPGTFMLARLSTDTLTLVVSLAVFAYIGFRLARPDWVLGARMGTRLAGPAGVVGGILQGAAGLSAPVSITFINAMKPPREAFIATISLFFATLGAVQLPLLVHYGLLDWTRFAQSCLALVPLVAFMPVGAFLARFISRAVFDRVILVMLSLIALRLFYGAVT